MVSRVRDSRTILATLFLIGSMLLSSGPAYAYCSGLTSYAGTWGAYGTTDFGPWDNVWWVQGRIKTFTPDPVVSASTSWVMLADRVRNKVAQTGWLRRAGWSGDKVFTQFWDFNGAYEAYFIDVGGSSSHNYTARYLGNGVFDFAYDATYWYQTWNLGWSPNKIQIASESKNHGDHFPGSNGYRVNLDTIQYINHSGVTNANLSYGTTGSSDVPGLAQLSGNSFQTWDKRCFDAG